MKAEWITLRLLDFLGPRPRKRSYTRCEARVGEARGARARGGPLVDAALHAQEDAHPRANHAAEDEQPDHGPGRGHVVGVVATAAVTAVEATQGAAAVG